MSESAREVIGMRGEVIAELCLTDYDEHQKALFRVAFLGDKWPLLDHYVELEDTDGVRPFLFVQVKSTATPLADGATHLNVVVGERDVRRLREVPAPTYVLGVHEPSKRVFAKAVHAGTEVTPIRRIPVAHELTRATLPVLHREVHHFWRTFGRKPETSVFP